MRDSGGLPNLDGTFTLTTDAEMLANSTDDGPSADSVGQAAGLENERPVPRRTDGVAATGAVIRAKAPLPVGEGFGGGGSASERQEPPSQPFPHGEGLSIDTFRACGVLVEQAAAQPEADWGLPQ